MNQFESEYLIKSGITLNDWSYLLSLVSKSTYLKISVNYKQLEISRTEYFRILKKFKDAGLVKLVKGDYRLNPYFYLRNDCSKTLATKLKKEWDNEPDRGKSEHLPKIITDQVTGEVFLYDENKAMPMDKSFGWYRPATIEDLVVQVNKNN